MGKRQYDRPAFENTIGLPSELVALIEGALVCEYASNKADGTPITTALSPVPGPDGRTIDINTGLAYPLKAERARRDPRVSLLFSEPKALPGDRPPVALVRGRATVRDADLQAGTDRYVQVQLATSPSFRQIPGFIVRRMAGYLARIWIEVTPDRIWWWPGGELDRPPVQWEAPTGIIVPPSDLPPRRSRSVDPPLVAVEPDPVVSAQLALADLGPPILTAPDDEGYPTPLRAASGALEGRTVHLRLYPHDPPRRDGPACLSFHAVDIKKGDMTANENRSNLGTVVFHRDHAEFDIERQTPTINLRPGLRSNLAMLGLLRRMYARLEPEAARRGQPVPKINLPDA